MLKFVALFLSLCFYLNLIKTTVLFTPDSLLILFPSLSKKKSIHCPPGRAMKALFVDLILEESLLLSQLWLKPRGDDNFTKTTDPAEGPMALSTTPGCVLLCRWH